MAVTLENTVRQAVAETLPSIGVFEGLRVDSGFGGGKSSKADEYLKKSGAGRTILNLRKGQVIFTQGDPASSVYYIQRGWVKLSVASRSGKSATVALHHSGDFIGVECVATIHPLRLSTATTFTSCTLLRVDKTETLRACKQDASFSSIFMTFLVNRCVLLQADLVDHIFNSSEKRLARTLLLLTMHQEPESTVPGITHEILAEMVGTTRSRISFFMNRFRKLGYVEYNGRLKVHPSIINVLLCD